MFSYSGNTPSNLYIRRLVKLAVTLDCVIHNNSAIYWRMFHFMCFMPKTWISLPWKTFLFEAWSFLIFGIRLSKRPLIFCELNYSCALINWSPYFVYSFYIFEIGFKIYFYDEAFFSRCMEHRFKGLLLSPCNSWSVEIEKADQRSN